jgi:hypothetical protein
MAAMINRLLSESRLPGVRCKPQPEECSFMDSARYRHVEELTVGASVLSDRKSQMLSGFEPCSGVTRGFPLPPAEY